MNRDSKENTENLSLAHELKDCLTKSWMTQALYVAAELGIADLLSQGPRTSEDLAAATNSHPSSLRRLLQALSTFDICRELKDGRFEMTSMGAQLAVDHPLSLRSWVLWWSHALWPVWGHLLDSVKTGESARKLLGGTEGYEHLSHDPSAEMVFNQALVELTRLEVRGLVQAYDFSRFKRVVDVGGGYGELLISILESNPSASGVLFELPHAIEGARHRFEQVRLAGRCNFVAGDFFQSVPGGGDAYVLKNILHNWNREQCRRILENCRRAMGEEAHLILIEFILPERREVSTIHQRLSLEDLNMLVLRGGQERSEAEFRELLDSAGFDVVQIASTGTLGVIEAVPFRLSL